MNSNRKQISHREMIDTSVGLMYVCMLSWCCVDTDNVTQQMRFLCREIVVGSAATGGRICESAPLRKSWGSSYGRQCANCLANVIMS